MEKSLPAIPAKRYFTIGEVSELCGVKPYVLRYWEQEFSQLKPMKRRGNRRYYQHHEVLLIRRIRELLYEQGFTISGARNRLLESAHGHAARAGATVVPHANVVVPDHVPRDTRTSAAARVEAPPIESTRLEPVKVEPNQWPPGALSTAQMRQELISIRGLLSGEASHL
ncbi:MAG TPA: MerR family transcriptional regulator [Caldimonas sp.]|nr:MerR family transcriptional regulator [Caldimonas sp.]